MQARLLWAAIDEIVYHEVRLNRLEAHGELEAPAAALAGLFGHDTLILAADVNRTLDASRGRETPYLLNLSMPNARFHTYPISAEEYQRQEFHAHV
jgi:hypothetical protein